MSTPKKESRAERVKRLEAKKVAAEVYDTGVHTTEHGYRVPAVRDLPSSRDWATDPDRACKDAPLDVFFPIGHGSAQLGAITRAKEICAGCPVRSACLEWSLTAGERWGIWGGLDERERRAVLARRRRGAA